MILLLAGLLRIIYLVEYHDIPEWERLTVDNFYHHNWAQDITDGNYFGDTTYFRAPFYVFCLAALYTISGPSILAARIFGMAIGVASVFMTFLLGYKIFNRRIGLTAALVQAIYPVSMYFEGELLLDPLFTLLLQITLYRLFIWHHDRTVINLAAVGVFTGLAAITRPTALILIPVIILLILWRCHGLGRIAQRTTIFLFAVGIPIAPIFVRNLAVAGDPVLISSQGGINLYIGNNEHADGLSAIMPEPLGHNWRIEDVTYIAENDAGRKLKPGEVSSYWTGRAVKWTTEHPLGFITLYLKKIYFSLSNREISNNRSLPHFFEKVSLLTYNPICFALIFPFAVIGGLTAFRRSKSVRLLLLVMTAYILTTSLFFFASRFRLPLLPCFIILAASGIHVSWEIARRNRASTVTIVILLILLGAGSSYPIVPLPRHHPTQELSSTGLYHYNRGDYKHALAYYRQAWVIDPEYPENHLNLGACFLKLGIGDSARHYFEEESRLHPERAKSYTNLASIYLVNNQYRRAREEAKKALSIKPYDVTSATILLRAAAEDVSVSNDSLWKTISALLPAIGDDLSFVNEAAGFLNQRGEHEKTTSILQRASNPSPPPIELDDLAFSSQFEASRARFLQEKAKSHFLMGYVYAVGGAYSESIKHSHLAINSDPNLTEAYVNLIGGYLATGQAGLADSVLAVALARFPDDGSIRELQRNLR